MAVLASAWLMQSLHAAGRQGTSVSDTQVGDGVRAANLTSREIEQRISNLLNDDESPYVSLAEADFRALGDGFDLPDGGRTVTGLARQAPGGAFDPREVAKTPAETLGLQG